MIQFIRLLLPLCLATTVGAQVTRPPGPTPGGGGGGGGETNRIANAGLTNAIRHSVLGEKVGVTNLVKTVTGLDGALVSDEGTNLAVSVELVDAFYGGGIALGFADGHTVSFNSVAAGTGMAITNVDGLITFSASGGEAGPVASPLALSNVVVLAMNGDDATAQRGRLDLPYLSLTNALAAMTNGDTLMVFPGRYPAAGRFGTNSTGLFRDETFMAEYATDVTNNPVRLANLHGISIVGIGKPTLWQTNQGDFLTLFNCRDVLIRDIKFEGSRTNPPANNPTVRSEGLLVFHGTNIGVRIAGCSFTNHAGHGILDHGVVIAQTHDVKVLNCEFDYLGLPQVPLGRTTDGGAMRLGGSRWQVSGNSVRNCSRGFVLRSMALAMRNVMIQGNIIRSNFTHDVFIECDTVGSADISIVGNQIEGGPSQDINKRAIYGDRSTRILIQGNSITNVNPLGSSAAIALELQAQGSFRDVMILDNVITRCGYGINVVGVTELRNCRIAGNQIREVGWTPITVNGQDGVVIEHNLINNFGLAGFVSPGLRVVKSTNTIVRHNTIYDIGSKVSYIGVRIDALAVQTVVEDNLIYNINTPFLEDAGTLTQINQRVTSRDGTRAVRLLSGTGSPEGVVTASIGSLFTRTDGAFGTTLYVKTNGVSNTGWGAVAPP